MTVQQKFFAAFARTVLGWSIVLWVFASVGLGQNRGKPAPAHEDVAYGPHEQNVLDVWLADSAAPTPLVAYIHGGGFRGGSKGSLAAETLRERWRKLTAAAVEDPAKVGELGPREGTSASKSLEELLEVLVD